MLTNTHLIAKLTLERLDDRIRLSSAVNDVHRDVRRLRRRRRDELKSGRVDGARLLDHRGRVRVLPLDRRPTRVRRCCRNYCGRSRPNILLTIKKNKLLKICEA